MKLYSDFTGRRTRQIVADVIALISISLWVWFGVTIFQLIQNLAGFGVQMEEAGLGLEKTMTDIGEALGGVPVVGGGIRAPFDGASEAGAALAEAGRNQQEAVFQLAVGAGIGVAILPVLMILVLWLVPRIRFIRRAGRAGAIVESGAGLELLALRALATQKLAAITAVDADALAGWRRGDPDIVRRLAQLELRSSGVRLRDDGV
jgi:hypothetical protein